MRNYRLLLLFLLFITGSFAPSVAQEKPLVIGVVKQIHSRLLSEERTLHIYLPEGYNANDTQRYSVIYLLDGGLDEDFIRVAGQVQFYNFDWVHILPKSIVVGIENTDRKRDFTFPTSVKEEKTAYPTTGGSAQFIAFLEKELLPFIHQEYKTNENTLLIGESLGGLLATEILLKKPQLFNRYLIISPSLWWSDGSLLNTIPVPVKNETRVYIASGKEGLTPTTQPRVMEVDANRLADQLQALHNKKLHVYFEYFPEENHATIGNIAVLKGLKQLYITTEKQGE